MTQVICKNGHNKSQSGVLNDGACRLCHQLYTKRWMKKRYHSEAEFKRKNRNSSNQSGWKRLGFLNQDNTVFTLVDFDRLYQTQQGRCKICKKHQSELLKALAVDHDHQTNKVRGLLCSKCNLNLGTYERFKAQIDSYLAVYREI